VSSARAAGGEGRMGPRPHYGWRARIGLILPSLNTTMEPEFQAAAPEGVSVHATRVFLEEATPANLKNLANHAGEAGRLLASADVDVIMFGCTSGSLAGGADWDGYVATTVQEASGVRATTTSTAVVAALRALGATRIAVGTPYTAEVNELERRFLEGHGLEVVAMEGLGFTKGAELHSVANGAAYALGRKVDRPEADCIFLSCTDLRTFDEISCLEADTKKLVVTSNGASLWHSLGMAGVQGAIEGLGVTLELLSACPPVRPEGVKKVGS
jgi:maleate isomerase